MITSTASSELLAAPWLNNETPLRSYARNTAKAFISPIAASIPVIFSNAVLAHPRMPRTIAITAKGDPCGVV